MLRHRNKRSEAAAQEAPARPLHGVNLSGWLVLEPWVTPSLFAGTGAFTELERKRLDKAKQLITVAVDQAATPAERQLAYRRVRQELDGLISVSDEAAEILEQKVALELPSGPTAS